MEEALRSFLRADAPMAARVGDRLDWGLRPAHDALPAVTLTLGSVRRTYTYRAVDDLAFYRVQADCWGPSYGAAKLTARALVAALARLPGQPGFAMPFIDNETDGTEPDASGQPVSRTRLDLRITYTTP